MNFLAYLVAIGHNSHVTGNHSADTCVLCSVNNLAHRGQIIVINHRVDGQISLDAVSITCGGNLSQIVYRKVIGRMRAHIQLADTEINGVSTGLNRSRKALT